MYCVDIHLLASPFSFHFFSPSPPSIFKIFRSFVLNGVWFWTLLDSFGTVLLSTNILFLLRFMGFRTLRTVFLTFLIYIYTFSLLSFSSITIFPAYYYKKKCPKCMVLAVVLCRHRFAGFEICPKSV